MEVSLQSVVCIRSRCSTGTIADVGVVSHLSFFISSALWETCYAAVERSTMLSVKDRITLSTGICHVLASLPIDQRFVAFEGMASCPLGRLESLSCTAKDTRTSPSELAQTLSKVGGEIQIISTMSKSFASALRSGNSDGMESGCDTSPDRFAPIPEPVLQTVHKAWSNISFAAANWVDDEVRYSALNIF